MAAFKAGDVLLDPDGKVTKILVVDEKLGTLHVRFYDGDFANAEAVKEAIKAKTLKWSIGHAPMAPDAFDPKTHTIVSNEPVFDDELEGYRYYTEEMGGAAAKPKEQEGFFARFWKTFGGNA